MFSSRFADQDYFFGAFFYIISDSHVVCHSPYRFPKKPLFLPSLVSLPPHQPSSSWGPRTPPNETIMCSIFCGPRHKMRWRRKQYGGLSAVALVCILLLTASKAASRPPNSLNILRGQMWPQIWNQQSHLPWYPCACCFLQPFWWSLRLWRPPNDQELYLAGCITTSRWN